MSLRTTPTAPLPVAAPDRRTVLRGFAAAGLVGAGGMLVACGGGGDSVGEAVDEATGAAGAAGSLAKAADIPVGGGVIVGDVVITQPAAGDFKAFSSTCTHQGCTVATVRDNRISCPCHGSVYSAEDGSVLNPPAPDPLPEVAISVSGEDIVRA